MKLTFIMGQATAARVKSFGLMIPQHSGAVSCEGGDTFLLSFRQNLPPILSLEDLLLLDVT